VLQHARVKQPKLKKILGHLTMHSIAIVDFLEEMAVLLSSIATSATGAGGSAAGSGAAAGAEGCKKVLGCLAGAAGLPHFLARSIAFCRCVFH